MPRWPSVQRRWPGPPPGLHRLTGAVVEPPPPAAAYPQLFNRRQPSGSHRPMPRLSLAWPCGLVCEVMARRIGHTGRGLVGLGLCSAFPARPKDLYTVFRLTPRSLEISAALTSLSRSSRLAQGPVTADLAPAWSTAVTVPCTLTTAPVSTQWRSAAARAPAVRAPESSGLADGEAGPVLGDLGDPIDAADGVRVWRRSHLGPGAGGVSPPGPRAAGLRSRIPPRPCGAGNPPGRPVFPQLCVRGRWGWRCSPE